MRKKNVRFQGTKNLLLNKEIKSKFGIWEYRIKEDRLSWSDEVYSILELNRNEFEPTIDRFFEFVHEDDREGLKKAYSKSISGSQLHGPLVHRVVGKTGFIKYVEELGFTEYDEGEAIKTTGLIRDVTKEVHVAKQLQDQHEYIESILDSLPNLIFITDENGIFIDAKAGDNNLFYQAPHNFIGKHYTEVMPPEINQLFDDSFIKLNEGIQQVKIEYELETKRGINYFEAILRRFSDQKVLVVVRDISKLKETINTFKKIAKLQNLLVNISSSFIAIDEDGVGNQINESLRILGEFIAADRFYIFDYDFEEMTASNTFEWCAKGIEPQLEILQDVPVEGMTEWIQNHRRGEIMEYENIHVLPVNHPIRLILEPQDIKSIITMPLMDGSKCIGFIGLD